jgi:RNA polymerase sigma-70 factor (sigma-E family)
MPEEGYESFDDFVRRRSVALQRFAYLVTRDRDDAQDCVQDALFGLLPRWDAVAATGRVDAYVNRSIVNASVSRWRKTGRLTPVADPVADWGREHTPDPTRAFDDADEAWRLCADLPPLQRAAVVLRFFDDLPFADVARALDCTEATARSHVFRALATLRVRLEDQR